MVVYGMMSGVRLNWSFYCVECGGRRRRVGGVVMDVEVRKGVGVGGLSGGPQSFS